MREYLVDLNVTQAAIRAGYSRRTARQIGYELMQRPDIQAAIEAAQAERSGQAAVTAADVVRELAILGQSNVAHYRTTEDGWIEADGDVPPEVMRAVASIERRVTTDKAGNETIRTRFRLWDKPAALRMLGQHLRLFGDQTPAGPPFVVNVLVAPASEDKVAVAVGQ